MALSHVNVQPQDEVLFRLLVEGVREYAIFLLDPDGRVASWNRGAERIKGYTREEIVGRHFSAFYTPEDQRAGKPALELDIAKSEGVVKDEGWRVRRDGSRFWANVTITTLYDETGRFVGFAKVTRDETQRRHIEDLETASRRMREFLALLAHELRNPLAPIRNATTIMHLVPVDDPSLAWARDVIDRQARHLTRLVDDLLDVSRITTGKLILAREQPTVADLVRQAVEATQPLFESRRQSLVVAVPDEPLRLDADPVRLTQVLVNLLNNASKFTPADGTIRISAGREGRDAVIRVRDGGVGIPASLLPHVFDLFLQGDEVRPMGEGGLGIGLTLVKSLVEMHGGSVEAHSEGRDRGATFVVRLPTTRPDR